jgi:F-type H+-transporting ATPase subunit b
VAIAAQIERRGQQAEEKIAQAEAQAVAEMRALAADRAVAAAERCSRRVWMTSGPPIW